MTALRKNVEISIGGIAYTIEAFVAQGGFCKVWHATVQTHDVYGLPTKLDFAIKVPFEHNLRDTDFMTRFAHEAAVASNVNHPNLVRVYQLATLPGGESCIIQEYVRDAKSLKSFLSMMPTLAPSLLLQSLYALRALHGQQPSVVHRDVSPGNILVTPSGWAKVIDLGLALDAGRTSSRVTTMGKGLGTPGCVAPEQMDDPSTVDGRADLYSLGRTFGASLLNRHPEHFDATLLPVPWQQICTTLTRYERDKRPASATEAIDYVVETFAAHHIAVEPLQYHMRELTSASPLGLRGIAWNQIIGPALTGDTAGGTTMLDVGSIEVLRAFAPAIAADAALSAHAFDYVTQSAVAAGLVANSLPYSHCDPFSDLLSALSASLDMLRREKLVNILARVALANDRYKVMDDIRGLFEKEGDASVLLRLAAVLDSVDPDRHIWGKGVIPGR